MHIIQVRGTSGSGKSWSIKNFMSTYGWTGSWVPRFKEGRKQPFYYELQKNKRSIIVLGHYETLCGGCDTFSGNSSASKVVIILQEILNADPKLNNPSTVVIMESLVLSEDVKWATVLAEQGHKLSILFLLTPTDKCLKQLRARRAEGGRTNPIKEDNTIRRVQVIENARKRLIGVDGISVMRCAAVQVSDRIHNILSSVERESRGGKTENSGGQETLHHVQRPRGRKKEVHPRGRQTPKRKTP